MGTEYIVCRRCGQKNVEGTRFCGHCGASLQYPPPPPRPQYPPPPQPSYVPPSPPRRSRTTTWLIVGGIGVVLVICLGLCIAFGGFNVIAAWLVMQTPQVSVGGTTVAVSPTAAAAPVGEALVVTGSGSVVVTSGEAGVVTTEGGAQLEIPNGAVPPTADGGAGSSEFRIEADFSSAMELPSEFAQVGPVYRLEPEGIAFGMPVQLTLPIPDDLGTGRVLGVATCDAASGTWQLLPAGVDEQAHTALLELGHFSSYGLFSTCFDDSFGTCSYIADGERWLREHGGWFVVVNKHIEGRSRTAFGKHLPAGVYYGVCVQGRVYDDPLAGTWNWRPPTDWMLGASSQKLEEARVEWWLPAGTYTLMEFYGIAETQNWDLDYVPQHRYYVRPMGSVRLAVNQKIEIVSPPVKLDEDGSLERAGFTWSRDPCWMKPVESPPVEPGENWGTFEIVNTHRDEVSPAPFGKRLPAGVYYGVCSVKQEYDDPLAGTWNWRPPLNWMMGAVALKDRDAVETYQLPAGTYTLHEVYLLTEQGNTDVNYVPEGRYYSRYLGPVYLPGGQTINYTSPAADPGPDGDWAQRLAAAGFVEGPNPCVQETRRPPPPTPTPTGTPTSVLTGTPAAGTPGPLPTHGVEVTPGTMEELIIEMMKDLARRFGNTFEDGSSYRKQADQPSDEPLYCYEVMVSPSFGGSICEYSTKEAAADALPGTTSFHGLPAERWTFSWGTEIEVEEIDFRSGRVVFHFPADSAEEVYSTAVSHGLIE
jgi:hypothetical protein